ncbi:hypothetical protein ABBQ32_011922 [Trebouxia sp. C0010 RCD-2024]
MVQAGSSSDSVSSISAATSRGQNKLASVLSGSFSGAVVSVCVQPLDVVRTRLQADAAKGISRSTAGAFRVLVKEHGVRGLWRGTSPTVARLAVGVGVHFLALEFIKDAVYNFSSQGAGQKHGQLTPVQAFMSGGISRGIAAAVTCPVTVVKTRMEYVSASSIKYKGTVHALRTIAASEGASGLMRGFWPTVLSNAPFSAIYYMLYTDLRQRFHKEGRSSTGVNFASGAAAAVVATLATQPADVIRTRMQLVAANGKHLSPVKTLQVAMQTGGAKALLVGALPRVLKRTVQTAVVWTMYEELVPRVTRVAEVLRQSTPRS